MAKGQVKGNKEAKKPKADKRKGSVSAYKQSQGKGGLALEVRSRQRSRDRGTGLYGRSPWPLSAPGAQAVPSRIA